MALIFILLTAPVWVFAFYSSDTFPYARYIQSTSGITQFWFSNYKALLASGGAYGKVGDILHMWFQPFVFPFVFPRSELFIFIGLIPSILGVVGIIRCKHKLKMLFLSLLIIFACLLLGPVKYNLIYRLLFLILPPLRFLHNYHTFSNFFLIIFLFFFSLGLLYIAKKTLLKQWVIPTMFIVILASLFCYNYYYIHAGKQAFSPLKVDDNLNALIQKHHDFKLIPRVKSVPLLNLPQTHRTMELVTQILKIPIAVDFPNNEYEIIKKGWRFPRALIYPKLYADILKSKTSQKLKSILLGVDLPVFSFYTNYSLMSESNMLKPENHEKVITNLQNSLIFSEKPEEKTVKNKVSSVWSTKLLFYNPNDIKLKIKTNQDGFLLFRDGYTSDWQVKINGVKEKLLRANYNEKAVYVEEGVHVVEFLYRPWEYFAALITYCLVTLWVIGFILIKLIFIRKILK